MRLLDNILTSKVLNVITSKFAPISIIIHNRVNWDLFSKTLVSTHPHLFKTFML